MTCANIVGDAIVPSWYTSQKPRNSDSGKWDFQEGKISEEKVHTSFKMGVYQCECDDHQVPCYTQQVNEKHKDEKQYLQLWVICQSQKDESCYCCVVFHHWVLKSIQLTRKNQRDFMMRFIYEFCSNCSYSQTNHSIFIPSR